MNNVRIPAETKKWVQGILKTKQIDNLEAVFKNHPDNLTGEDLKLLNDVSRNFRKNPKAYEQAKDDKHQRYFLERVELYLDYKKLGD